MEVPDRIRQSFRETTDRYNQIVSLSVLSSDIFVVMVAVANDHDFNVECVLGVIDWSDHVF